VTGLAVERLRTVLSGHYTLERELGRGGTATVYLAQDLKHARPVALKVLRPDVTEVLGATQFLREIRIAARLTHPNILSVHDSGKAGGLLYYVMPYIAGDSLRERIRRRVREHTSPHHVPRRIVQVADIPRTISGKITELAVREVIHGRPVKNRDALANPAALDLYRDLPELRT